MLLTEFTLMTMR